MLALLPSKIADARMHITNADGSVAEMCGNGLRCVIRHLARNAAIETGAGVLRGTIEAGDVRVELGEARIIEESIPVELEGRTLTAIGLMLLSDVALAAAVYTAVKMSTLARSQAATSS